MEQYNRYHESLDIDCGCDDKSLPKIKKSNDCCCGGTSLPSHDNELEVLVRQLRREVKELLKTTQAKLLCQDKKIAETMVYIKNNLSNALRNLLDSMVESGELEEIIKSIIIDNVSTLQSQIDELNEEVDTLTNNQIKVYNNLDSRIVGNKSNIDNLSNRIDEINNDIKNQIKDTLVVFGDSWSDLSVPDSIWSTVLTENLNLVNKNYAVNGAGFIAPSDNLISSQIARFNLDVESQLIKSSKVKYVVVLGGINDYRNSITANNLLERIRIDLDSIRNIVPNAKIVYISNCEYPYTKEQFNYWNTINNAILNYTSYDLTNKIGKLLFNSTYFHLTQVGQMWLAKNIESVLTGGEIKSYLDTRKFEDDNVVITHTNIPLTNDTSCIYISLYIKRGFGTSYTYNLPSNEPGLSYGGQTGLFGAVGTGFKKIVCDTTQRSITFGLDSEGYATAYYYLNQMIITSNT